MANRIWDDDDVCPLVPARCTLFQGLAHAPDFHTFLFVVPDALVFGALLHQIASCHAGPACHPCMHATLRSSSRALTSPRLARFC